MAIDESLADALRARGDHVGKDAAGRLRRLAPSPNPVDVVEAEAVKQLVDEGKIVVAAGGGGTPVYDDPGVGFEGVDAVVDKDRTAAILGARLGADTLLILTDVAAVHHDWGTEHARPIRRMTVSEAHTLLRTESLGRGSMVPKLEAAIKFVELGGRRAVIAHLAEGMPALEGETGTSIFGDSE